jgi:5-methylcytosine-specific restriction endonuclease McrBC regulatory subunit McrC
VIGPRDAPWLIVDAKYKNPLRETWGKEYFHNEDLYQAFTYAAALSAPAVLVYPKVDEDIDVEFQAGTHRLRVVSVPLNRSVRESSWVSRLLATAAHYSELIVSGAAGGRSI